MIGLAPKGKATFVQPLPNITCAAGALSYLSVNQGQGQAHHAPFAIHAATENVNTPKGS
jgi:hypothetical protein